MEAYLRRRGLRVDRNKESQFSDAWWTVTALIFALGLILREPALVHMAVLMVSIVAFAWVWTTVAIWRVRVDHVFSERRAFVGETVTLRLRVENRKPIPVPWLRVQEYVPEALPIEGGRVTAAHRPRQKRLESVFALRWFQRADQVLTVRCTRRGFYPFGPLTVSVGDPFGFFVAQREVPLETWLIVYPEIVPLPSVPFPAHSPIGDVGSRVPLFEDPIRVIGVRDYQPEDDIRRVHWKATARYQRLQTRLLEPSRSHTVVIFLDVATLLPPWAGVIPPLLERAVSVAASLAYYAATRRWAVGLVTNGVLPRSDQPVRVPPGRHPGQLTLIFELLAAVTPLVAVPIDVLLRRESPRLPMGATFVVISPVNQEALSAALQELVVEGRPVVYVSLAREKPPETLAASVPTYHLPWETSEPADTVDPEAVAATFAYPAGGAYV